MEQIDLDALQQLLKLPRQGDVVDVAKTVRLYSPDAPCVVISGETGATEPHAAATPTED